MAQHQLLAAFCILVVIYATSSVEGVCRKKTCVKYCVTVLGRQKSDCLQACARQAKACKVCVGPFKCLRCNPGYKRIGFKCYRCPTGCDCDASGQCNSCLSGYVRNVETTGERCLACSPGCESCGSKSGPGYCDTCKTGFLKVDYFCQACTPNCQDCSRAGAGSCDTCITGYKLVVGDSGPTCAACPANCKSCDIAGPTYCDKCLDHYGLSVDHKTCQACASNCLSCNTQGYNKCDDQQCTSGNTYNSADKICCLTAPCTIDYCAVYNSGTSKCTTCAPGYTAIAGGTSCEICAVADCYDCSTDSTLCDKCVNGKDFTSPSCVTAPCTTVTNCNTCAVTTTACDTGKCYIGYRLNAASTCEACGVSHCDNCDNAIDKCDKCAFGYTLSSDTKSCTASCDPNCATSTCSGVGKCDSYCNAGFVLASDHTCQPCAANCNSCAIEGPYMCDGSQCKTGYSVDANSKCIKDA